MKQAQDLHVKSIEPLISPIGLKEKLPSNEAVNKTVVDTREAINKIITGDDDRLLAIVGPCSIHDTDAAIDYAKRLLSLKEKLSDKLLIIMRVYFEKPRTTIGWRGLIYDPDLDGSEKLQEGMEKARQLLIDINALGLPCATELLDPVTPQYIADLLSWSCIGARTTESQTHREMSSGLSMPVGFKNGTSGNLQVAVDAMVSCLHPHKFLGVNHHGQSSVISTTGNKWSHIVLRGGHGITNYDANSIAETTAVLNKAGLCTKALVDCSHANSEKKFERQEIVLNDVLTQCKSGSRNILGFMLESNINEGNQKVGDDVSALQYGVSITDQCISWETTERLLTDAYENL